ncbi:hypothetical protein GGI07_004375 [Coemansia sp. Benny D115]|nr:hypothetical protein GGI07_004375 [Coemansia sp. Benny D115]
MESQKTSQELSSVLGQKLSVISTQADQVRELVDRLRERVQEGELVTKDGVSFLEVKHHTMLSYISNLAYLSLLKLNGKSIEAHPVVSHLVEDRTVLERMKPLEQRLKYQVDKLLRHAVVAGDAPDTTETMLPTTDDPERAPLVDNSAKLAAAMLSDDAMANPSAFKPNPGSLAVDIRGEDDEMSREDGIYRAPKLVPVHYEEEGNLSAKREKSEQRMMERAARSRLVQDLMTEYDDRPEAASASGNPTRALVDSRMERLAQDAARYEEENFKRLTLGKKERKGMRTKLMGLEDEFAHLNDFAGIASLHKSSAASGGAASSGKQAILDRLKQKRDNESPAEKAKRRRRGGMGADEELDFSSTHMQRNKRGNFQRAKSKSIGKSKKSN